MSCLDNGYQNFNAKEFFALSYSKGSSKEKFLELMYEELEKEDQNGEKLLELGAGPSVHTSLLASKYFTEIVLSEYAEPNKIELVKWVNQEEGAFDWSRYVSLISDLENSDENMIETRTRTAIKDIVTCDLTKNEPVPQYTGQLFDCIVSSLTLECCSTDIESYNNAVQKVSDLLAPGGKLILMAVFGQSHYVIGGRRYNVLKLKQSDVENALKKAGFTEIKITRIQLTSDVSMDGDNDAFVRAVKAL